MYERTQRELRLIGMLHYIYGGLGLFCSMLPGVYLVIGLLLLQEDTPIDFGPQPVPKEFMAAQFIIGSLVGLAVGYGMSFLNLYAGYCLRRRKYFPLCVVVDGFNCVMFPIGTALGVCSLIVLSRAATRVIFESSRVQAAQQSQSQSQSQSDSPAS